MITHEKIETQYVLRDGEWSVTIDASYPHDAILRRKPHMRCTFGVLVYHGDFERLGNLLLAADKVRLEVVAMEGML